MKTNNLVSTISLSFILIAVILIGCSITDSTPQPTETKPPIKVVVELGGKYVAYSITKSSGSIGTSHKPSEVIPMIQGDAIRVFNGLPNDVEGSINIYQVTNSKRVLLVGKVNKGQFSLEFKY